VETGGVEALFERLESVLSPEVPFAFGDRQQLKDARVAMFPATHLELGTVRVRTRHEQVIERRDTSR